MPVSVCHFSQAVLLRLQDWTTGAKIASQFEQEAHSDSFVTTIVAYVISLHDVLYLWRIRVDDSSIGCL